MSKVLVITGSEHSGWDTVARFFSGCPDAQHLFDNCVTAFSSGLSTELIGDDSTYEEAKEALVEFSATQPLGWADNNSVHFLPFWASVDQNCQFLLVYSSPERAFASAMKVSGGDPLHVDEVMANWEKVSRATLNFFQQNRDRSLLINVSSIPDQPDDLIAICASILDKKLSLVAQDEVDTSLKVIEAKAALLLPNYDELHELYDELQGAASLPGLDIMLTGISGNRKIEFATEGIKEFLRQQEQLSQLIAQYSALDSQKLGLEEKWEATSTKLQSHSSRLESGNSELKQALQTARQDQELSELQVHQLQEELEAQYIELAACKAQSAQTLEAQQETLSSKTASLEATNAQLTEQRASTEQDLELTLLQIHQLQEELEHYYSQYQTLKDNSVVTGLASSQYRSIDHASASNCQITASYAEDGYLEISLQLEKLILGDGRKFETLQCKLVLKAGMVGLEFRPNPERGDENLLNWPLDMSDEHGPYLLFLPNPNEVKQLQQQTLKAAMSTDDRQVIYSVARVIADCFMTGSAMAPGALDIAQLKQWRLCATRLCDEAKRGDSFLSINTIKLNEEFRTEGYEHLWLQCDNLQIGQQLFDDFSFKLAAVSTNDKASSGFADYLLLEFRELIDGRPPFEAWPPADADEHGPKLLVTITTTGNKPTLNLPEPVSENDQDFIRKLAQALPNMLTQLEGTGGMLERAWDDWHQKTKTLASTDLVYSREARGVAQTIKGLLRRVNVPGKH